MVHFMEFTGSRPLGLCQLDYGSGLLSLFGSFLFGVLMRGWIQGFSRVSQRGVHPAFVTLRGTNVCFFSDTARTISNSK